MKNPKNQPAERGLALVVVVSLMALLTVMILGLLMLSSNNRATANNDVSARQAENIAKAAVNTVIADIYDEFAIGATVTNVDAVQKVYTVTNPASMVPNKALRDSTLATATGFENLVKQSASGVNFATGLASRASGISTDTASSDGRMISPATWAKAQLAPAPAANQVPQWVYLTRNGSNPTDYNAANKDATATNTDFVVGRYAYQVYDVGGLLDANVALSRASDTANGKDAKNSPYWAVAAALPGGSNALGDRLADWRHPVGKDPSTLVEWGERKGWNEVFNNGTPSVQATASDQAFLSRQDLIAFQKKYATDFPASLLPYFTHANFSLNQSSHAPDPNRPKVISGGNAHNLDDQYNPSHLAIRSAIPSEIDPQTRPTVPVTAKRFPLDRLKLVVPGGNAALITQFFGLTYVVASNEWVYVDSAVKDLSAVALLKREPNFAELLMSTLHVGSLGGWGNEIDWNVPQLTEAKSINYHVIQIMANIIDQWDADSFPTVIRLKSDSKRIVGIEDLPRIYGIRGVSCRVEQIDPTKLTVQPPTGFGNINRHVYLQRPFIWNPHQPTANPAADTPTEFRVTAKSGIAGGGAADIMLRVATDTQWSPTMPQHTNNFTPVGALQDFEVSNAANKPWHPDTGAFVEFQASLDPNIAASFRQPYELRYPGYPNGSNSSCPNVYNKLVPADLSYPGSPEPKAMGFFVGEFWSSELSGFIHATNTTHSRMLYELQYKDLSGEWVTFDDFYSGDNTLKCRVSTDIINFNGHIGIDNYYDGFYRMDPRTKRLGTFNSNDYRAWDWWGYPPAKSPTWKQLYTIYEGQTLGVGVRADFPAAFENASGRGPLLRGGGAGLAANLYSPFFYQQNLNNGNGHHIDPDNVVRPAMGAHAAGTAGYPLADRAADPLVNSRAVILNRPFRSVAELGYVFRDQPWKQMDFSNPESGDGALLEVFCLHSDPATYESSRIVRGRINPNSAPAEVMAALFQGTAKNSGNLIIEEEALALGNEIKSWVAVPANRFRSKSEIVGKTISGTSTGFSQRISTILTGADKSVSERREAVLRALADSADTRTWNLMVDVVAQAGRLTNNASSLAQMNVYAQTQRWIFLSIDRLTGEILHQSSEIPKE